MQFWYLLLKIKNCLLSDAAGEIESLEASTAGVLAASTAGGVFLPAGFSSRI